MALASHGNVQYGESGEGGVATPGYVRLLQGEAGTPNFDGAQAAYKILTVTPDANVEIARSGNTQAVVIQIWRGADPHYVLDAPPLRTSGTSGLPDPGGITTATNGALVVAVGFLKGADDSANTTAPSGYSNLVVNGYGAASATATVMLASKEVATAGAEDPGAFGGAASTTWYGLTFAFRLDDATDPTDAWERVCEMVCQLDFGSGTRSFTFPESPAEDDVVVVLMGSDEEIGTGAAGDGGINTAGYTDLDASTTANTPGYKLAYKVMGVTPDTAIVLAESDEREQVALVTVLRGVNVGSPIDAAVQISTGTSAAPDPAAVTTANPDALVIACAVVDDIGFEAGGITFPTGYTHPLLGYCGTSASVNGATVLMAVKQVDAPGSENPSAFTASASDQWRTQTFALAAEVVPGLIETAQDIEEAFAPVFIETAEDVEEAQQLDLTIDVTWRRPTRIDFVFPKILPVAESIPVVVDAQATTDGSGAMVWFGAGAGEITASGGRVRGQWDGAVLSRSADGALFEEVGRTRIEATFGYLVEALPGIADTSVPDDTNTLRVKVYKDRPLATITRAELLTGRYNLAAIGNNENGWELISFEAAVGTIGGLESEVGVFDEWIGDHYTPLARYDITGLLRARYGTVARVGESRVGDRFVLLDAAMVSVPMSVADIGGRFHWRATSIGARSGRRGTPIATTFVGRSALLPPPTNIAATRDPDPGVSQDLDITWTPGAVEGAWLVDPPFSALGIAGWVIDVLDASEAVVAILTTTVTANGSAVDADASAAAAFYDFDDIAADLGDDMGLAVPVTNPGAETGDLTGWTSSTGSMASLTVREDTFPRTGFRMFVPNGADAEHIITQQIELVTIPDFNDPDWLDGNTKAKAWVWQANSIAGDTGQIILRAIDADTTTVLATVTSTLQEITPIETWQEVVTAELTIPAAARYLRVELRAVKVGGSDAGVCFDDLTVRLTGRVGPVHLKVYALDADGRRGAPGEASV